MSFALRTAWASLRGRPGRAALTAGGIVASGLVLGVALTVAYALSTGFDRAADRADLPTIVARFDDEDAATVAAAVGDLPNLAAASYRFEQTRVRLTAGEHRLDQGVIEVVRGGRRGYVIVAGRDVRSAAGAPLEAVVERGLATQWGLHVGDQLEIGRVGSVPIVGISVAPDNVAYPLAKTARVMVGEGPLLKRLGAPPGRHFPVNTALLWAQDRSRADVLVSAARQSSFGLRGLRFLTRSGVEALVGQAAGIVVALLVAFGVVATGLAGVLLGAGAQSEVQRALDRIGLQRALGVTSGAVVAVHAVRGALVAAPAAALGLSVGAVVGRAPTERVLASLNELPPSVGRLVALLALVWLCAVALVAAASALPAWRAARRTPAALLRGGDVATPRRAGRLRRHLAGQRDRHARAGRVGRAIPGQRTREARRRPTRGGLAALGARLVVARRLRFASVVAVLGAAASVVLLLLALASLLQALRDDPATLGKRYQLTTRLPDSATAAVEAIPGVEAAAVRYSTDAVSAFSLGSPLKVIAYSSGDRTRFEAPPLASGRRARAPNEAEVGLGLADALGLRPGSTLAIQPLAQQEVRFRVVGIVRALQDEGRVAYVAPDRLLAAGVALDGPMVLRLKPGANRARIAEGLNALGARADAVRGATGDSSAFLDVLAGLLQIVAATVALVCLHALVSALALTARERRGAVATLRAAGADARALRRLLGGAALVVVAPAAVVAVVLETTLLSPLVAHLAAGYADLPLGATAGQIALVAGGLLLLSWAAAALTGRRLVREPVVAGLREEA
ncbi:FtsX-like permease family protein [Baekduia sp.]|jgi:ABC-type lipoprotein release transport system permease subunit|uniref:FtsX-like permease family protein n=1 Tax=Baekduia sp. TaxID=2600305 RepID=UPI002DF891E7|nr:FtsX-like permease family protein [Baekduia sp.]